MTYCGLLLIVWLFCYSQQNSYMLSQGFSKTLITSCLCKSRIDKLIKLKNRATYSDSGCNLNQMTFEICFHLVFESEFVFILCPVFISNLSDFKHN